MKSIMKSNRFYMKSVKATDSSEIPYFLLVFHMESALHSSKILLSIKISEFHEILLQIVLDFIHNEI